MITNQLSADYFYWSFSYSSLFAVKGYFKPALTWMAFIIIMETKDKKLSQDAAAEMPM
jgi:hypothetical protein